MALLEHPADVPSVDYGLYDADEHYYEAEDALTRHLAPAFRNLVKWVDVGSRRTMLIGDRLVTVVPNPTYDPVGVPGSLEVYFRSANTEGRPIRDIVQMQPIQPEYRDRSARLEVLDRQGVELTWLLPSLGLGLEEMLLDDTEELYAVFRAYNQWLDDDWGYDRDGRIQTGPMLSLMDPAEAELDMATAIERGARFVVLRPAPVDIPGKPRSPGDPIYDRVWAMAAEAGVVIAFHAADSGYGKYVQAWGEPKRFTGLKTSTFSEVLQVHLERPIFDTMAALICHGVFERHPSLRVASLELGASWADELVRRLKRSYGKTPQEYGSDPVEQFHEHVWVAPFYEDELDRVRDAVPIERILLGSDFPHPEGLSEPRAWIADFASLTDEERRLVLRENLKGLSGR
jgi:predicted TIM-barrel fold metal-dependent hydrolase